MSVAPIVKKPTGILGPYNPGTDGALVTGMIPPSDGGLGADVSGALAGQTPVADGVGGFVMEQLVSSGAGPPAGAGAPGQIYFDSTAKAFYFGN